MGRFCLYTHKKTSDNTPFYVGIGLRNNAGGFNWVFV